VTCSSRVSLPSSGALRRSAGGRGGGSLHDRVHQTSFVGSRDTAVRRTVVADEQVGAVWVAIRIAANPVGCAKAAGMGQRLRGTVATGQSLGLSPTSQRMLRAACICESPVLDLVELELAEKREHRRDCSAGSRHMPAQATVSSQLRLSGKGQ